MTGRIKELAEQLDFPVGNENPQWAYEPALYKFAELIVKECMHVVIQAHRGHINPKFVIEPLKEHFGVEE